ncbi:MAG: DbpA RNA binding domain-containing protein [Methylovulum sp.]|nr:DbpA RNA binding domain-containing protein [Methylovulum sp.]
MTNSDKLAEPDPNDDNLLKNRLQDILDCQPLETQRQIIMALAAEFKVDTLSCAAALLYLLQTAKMPPRTVKPGVAVVEQDSGIKMVRYRLDVGSQHQVTLEDLTKVLVEESGVDKKNINNVAIRGLYTLIELPDAMPPDIFQHLKTVEINQQKLDIKRVKARANKKRSFSQNRRGKQRSPKANHEASDQLNN